MKWLNRLDLFIINNNLLKLEDTLLVAVSGGMDSMFLLTYLLSKNYKLAVAHCNFGLRGDESDGDEHLVKTFCETNGIKIHLKKFDTQKFADSNGISIQMAARDLRYRWFHELCEMGGYTKLVTAHHKTDNAETILLNMARGTRLKGLEGISALSGNTIRPLLCLSRTEIESAVKELDITYREDSSNSSDKYYRNRLRHHVLPEFQKINPAFENTLEANAEIVKQANTFIHHFIETFKKEAVKNKNDTIEIDSETLLKWPEPKFVLFAILNEYGFNASSVDDIFHSLNGLSGKQFFSATHRLILNRDHLIIATINEISFQSYTITEDTKTIETPHHHWEFEIKFANFQFPISSNQASFDFDKLTFPLILRPWQQGDKIKPLGMKGHKKVSDILIDKKISLHEKNKIWVIISDNELIWVSGLVVNDDYRLNETTKKVFCLSIKKIN
jgi:tRNA(Ile)-lysidine synthase